MTAPPTLEGSGNNRGSGPPLLLRPRLLARLNEVTRRRVILVWAPPGYGKSTLVRAWARRYEAHTCYVNLTPRDVTGDALRAHLAAALARDVGDCGRVLGRRLRKLAGNEPVADLINGFAELGEITLIIDGYEHLRGSSVEAALASLLDYLPQQLHLVLVSRVYPALPLARLRVRGGLGEIGLSELAFTPEEVRDYCISLNRGGEVFAGGRLSVASRGCPSAGEPIDLEGLCARTRGWPMGLRLSLQAKDPDSALACYFNRVLDLDAATMAFLRRTIDLDRLTADAVRAATGCPDGQALLESLESRGLFLLPLDEVRGAWCYHPMFVRYLRAGAVVDGGLSLPVGRDVLRHQHRSG